MLEAPSTPTARLDGIIIATDQPAVMANWYAAILGATQDGDNIVRHDDLQIIVFPHDAVSGRAPQPERIMVNFHVDDIDAFTAHANSLGATWKRPFECEAFGLMATLEDPDGNYVQFLQLDHPAPT